MILDAEFEFSDAQSLASKSASSETQSTNVAYLTGGKAGKDGWGTALADLFRGGTVYWHVQINTILDCTLSSILEPRLYVHSAATSIKSGNKLVEMSFPVDAAAGTTRTVAVPNVEYASTEVYMGVVYYVSGGTKIVTGAVDSWLSNSPGQTQLAGSSLT